MGLFSIEGFKRVLVGEKMPDKNDPGYKERYERDVEAGRKFAKAVGLTWLGRHYVRLAEANKKAFFAIVLGLMMFFFIGNLYRFSSAVGKSSSTSYSVHMQDSVFKHRISNHHK